MSVVESIKSEIELYKSKIEALETALETLESSPVAAVVKGKPGTIAIAKKNIGVVGKPGRPAAKVTKAAPSLPESGRSPRGAVKEAVYNYIAKSKKPVHVKEIAEAIGKIYGQVFLTARKDDRLKMLGQGMFCLAGKVPAKLVKKAAPAPEPEEEEVTEEVEEASDEAEAEGEEEVELPADDEEVPEVA